MVEQGEAVLRRSWRENPMHAPAAADAGGFFPSNRR